MCLPQAFRGALDVAERLSGPPDDNPWNKWFLGVVVAALPVGYGIEKFGNLGLTHGVVFLVCLGLLLHVHCFWHQNRHLQPYAELAENVLAAPLILLLIYGFFRFAANFA
jgi:hypothetical protein